MAACSCAATVAGHPDTSPVQPLGGSKDTTCNGNRCFTVVPCQICVACVVVVKQQGGCQLCAAVAARRPHCARPVLVSLPCNNLALIPLVSPKPQGTADKRQVLAG
ncbi:hypothetical protein GUJ93_ZPchr0008g12616 [Zizania palustris]|uniref:Uncharacterized protein n=1 Tax=Zizania palustris TaxID=103762 RepID=A0A8J5VKY7_ZIZPA|nr:hypothetical protein GUJ93_ZPchr0008g12616 [Zizania palustris]